MDTSQVMYHPNRTYYAYESVMMGYLMNWKEIISRSFMSMDVVLRPRKYTLAEDGKNDEGEMYGLVYIQMGEYRLSK
jgi:hypothetical protein